MIIIQCLYRQPLETPWQNAFRKQCVFAAITNRFVRLTRPTHCLLPALRMQIASSDIVIAIF